MTVTAVQKFDATKMVQPERFALLHGLEEFIFKNSRVQKGMGIALPFDKVGEIID